MSRFTEIVQNIRPIPQSHTFLISHNGKIVANSTGKYINENFSKILSYDVAKYKLLDNLSQGRRIMYVQKDTLRHKNIVILEPFYFGEIDKAWGIGVIVPLKVIRQDTLGIIKTALFVALIGLLVMVLVLVFVINQIIRH